LQPPGLNDFIRGQPPYTTTSITTAYSTALPQEEAANGVQSHWNPYDNNSKFDENYKGRDQDRQANGAVGMDGEWRQFRSPRSLRIGGSEQIARGMDCHKWTGISAAYNGPIYHSRFQTNAEGVPFEHRHPTQSLPDKLQPQPFLHIQKAHHPTKTTNEVLVSPQNSATPICTSENASSASRTQQRTLAPSNQQAIQTCHQASATPIPHRPYTEEDFYGIRKGGRLMEDKKTWDVLTEINHHPAFNRVYNRPALPPNPNPKSTNSTGISNFKWYGDLVKALDATDRRLLQEFIVVSKHYASTGQLPPQPSTSQAINVESENEEDNGVHSLDYIGNHQASDSRKRSREQELDLANQPGRSQKRLRANENLQTSSREWKFSSMEEADAYLTSHGYSTVLEIANKYLLSQGHPLVCIKRTADATLADSSSRLRGNGNLTGFQHYEQQPSKASCPSSEAHGAHKSHNSSSPASVAGFAGVDVSDSSEVQPNRRGKFNADADGDNNNRDSAEMESPLAKKSRTSSVMTMMQATQQATPPRRGSTPPKRHRQPHNKQASLRAHLDGPPEVSITEKLDVYGGSVSQLDSGYQYPDPGFEGVCSERLHASVTQRNTDQVHSAMTIKNPNLSEFKAFPAKAFGQTQVQESTYQFFEEGNVYGTFENLDFEVQNIGLNSQQNRNAGRSDFDFESLEIFLEKQKQAHDSNIGFQNFMSSLQSCGDARGSEFDSEILDHFLPNQEYGE